MTIVADTTCKTDGANGWSFASTTPESARDRILAAASHLFCHQGFSATGVDSIIAQAGTAKATLYKHFSSKEDLIAAVLDAEGAAWRSWFFGRLGQVQGTARDRVLAIFDILEEWFSDPSFYGCPFINAVAEFDSDNVDIRKTADAHKAHLLTWLQAKAIEMNASDPRDVALNIVVLVDGAIVAAQHSRDPSFARRARMMAGLYLDGLTTR